jgi:membrane protease YdiL (CAAX protease family)
MEAKNWFKRFPILLFIIITLVWSFVIWSFLFLYIKPGELMTKAPPISFLFVIVGGFGPSLSGLFTTWLVYGRKGLKDLLNRFHISRVGGWWFAILIIPAVTALTPISRWVSGYPVDVGAMLRLLGPGVGLGLTAGLMEEIGWRGFLLPHLLRLYSPTKATLLLGLIWGGLWHGYADYFGLGGRGIFSLILIILLGPLLLTAWSFIITWVYERTQGSLLIAFFMHASISSSALIFGQTYSSTAEEIIWTAISTGLAILAAALIWIRRQPQQVKS